MSQDHITRLRACLLKEQNKKVDLEARLAVFADRIQYVHFHRNNLNGVIIQQYTALRETGYRHGDQVLTALQSELLEDLAEMNANCRELETAGRLEDNDFKDIKWRIMEGDERMEKVKKLIQAVEDFRKIKVLALAAIYKARKERYDKRREAASLRRVSRPSSSKGSGSSASAPPKGRGRTGAGHVIGDNRAGGVGPASIGATKKEVSANSAADSTDDGDLADYDMKDDVFLVPTSLPQPGTQAHHLLYRGQETRN